MISNIFAISNKNERLQIFHAAFRVSVIPDLFININGFFVIRIIGTAVAYRIFRNVVPYF